MRIWLPKAVEKGDVMSQKGGDAHRFSFLFLVTRFLPPSAWGRSAISGDDGC